MKITGEVLKVDGGKTLTSRGQTDWYGMQYMTRKFEQEGTASYINYNLNKERQKPAPTNDPEALEDWVNETSLQSKWAIKSDDAHLKQAAMYSNQEENLEHIKHAQEAFEDGKFNRPKAAH